MRRVLPALALALLAGCASTNPGVPDTQADIPVPQGYTRAPDDESTKSYWEQREGYRLYRVSYEGMGQPGDATTFYMKQMPQNGWKQETATPDATGGGSMLSYLKDNERCKVWIKARTEEKSRVTVEIGYCK